MANGYDWDIFVSYPRRDPVGPWVREHFYPVLARWLGASMQRQPKIFIDFKMEDGTHWPSNLSQSLLTSRYMIAVLAPPYFGSAWCMAEWTSMRERQKLLNLGVGGAPGLCHPIRFFDGESFPQEAKEIQDTSDYTPYSAFQSGKAVLRTKAYKTFELRVQELALKLAQRVDAVPPWQAGWPAIAPQAMQAAPIGFDQVGLR